MATPLINGESYAWAQIVCTVLNVPIVGITEISYKEMQEKKDNYGQGKYPVSRGYGKIETEGSITLYMEEVEALRRVAPNGRILDIPPFPIVVTYEPANGIVAVVNLYNCEFKEDSTDTKQGDTDIQIKLPLIISHMVKDVG